MIYAIVAILALILDQAVKYWTTVNIVVDTGEAKLIPGFLHLANVHNTGAAFSFLEGARWFFVAVCALFVCVVLYALVMDILTGKLLRWTAVSVMAGAVGNCIDRIVCGYVVDMFEFDFLIFGRRFPVFNVADLYITFGVIVFCVSILLDKPKTEKKTVTDGNAPAQAAPAPAEKKPFNLRIGRKAPNPTIAAPEQPQAVPLHPEDPFAEWERSMQQQEETQQTGQQPAHTQYTQPERSPQAPAAPAASPAADRPQEPKQNAEAHEAESFSLEDILAEFRDD